MIHTCRMIYFTGTGNSRRIALLAAETLASRGLDAAAVSIEDPRSRAAAGECDLLGVVFPVHAFGVPLMMDRFLSKMPGMPGRAALVISVHGNTASLRGHEGNAVYQASGILRRKGYDVIGGTSVGMPVNFVVAVRPPAEEAAREMETRAREHISYFIDEVMTGQRPQGEVWTPIRMLCSFLHSLFRWGVRWCNPMNRLRRVDDSCTGCGTCESICPEGNIRVYQGRPRWGGRCSLCLRCINLCPEDAIQTPTGTRRRPRYSEASLRVEDLARTRRPTP